MKKSKQPPALPGLVISDITARESLGFVGLSELKEAAETFPDKVETSESFHYSLELSPGSVRITRSSSIPRISKLDSYKPRTEITCWSAKSRSKMVSRLCSLDYQPMLGQPKRTPCLITLTYPGNWQQVVPDGVAAKRHLKLFRSRYQRMWGEQLRAVWKMEFQRRGACHFHLFTSVPNRPGFAEWLSQTWTDIVSPPDPNERSRHLLAGTGIDYTTGARGTDPKRVAVYFSKHNSPNQGSKEYQNRPPAEWIAAGSVGRFWGYWNIEPLTVRVPIGESDALIVARVLRRWTAANTRPVRRKVERVCQRTGEVRHRWVTRRKSPRMSARIGFVSVNDGAKVGSRLADVLCALSAGRSSL